MNHALHQSVIKTLAYFDIFDYPLTREELFLYLWQSPPNVSYSDFILEIENLLQSERARSLESFGGYYFLPGRRDIIAKRERKILYTEERIKIARRGTKKLRYIPFVRALFVCNQLPVGVKKNSDIDVFIVVREGRIWLTRFLITVILSIFHLRRTKKNVERKMCLSFYVTDNNLDLSNICIGFPDVYQAYWNSQLIPVYDSDNFYTKIVEKNTWVKKVLGNMPQKYSILDRWNVFDTKTTKSIKSFFEWVFSSKFGNFCEKSIRALQLKKMKGSEKVVQKEQIRNIVIDDTMLKFHENDRKQYFKDEWEKRWKKYI